MWLKLMNWIWPNRKTYYFTFPGQPDSKLTYTVQYDDRRPIVDEEQVAPFLKAGWVLKEDESCCGLSGTC